MKGRPLFFSLFFVFRIVWTYGSTDFFLVSPGDGEEFVYSPIGANATLHCAVNNSNPVWRVNDLNFAEFGSVLHSRGIFQTQMTFMNGITTSNITIFGDTTLNNNSRVCCRSAVRTEVKQNCTTLIIYGKVN